MKKFFKIIIGCIAFLVEILCANYAAYILDQIFLLKENFFITGNYNFLSSISNLFSVSRESMGQKVWLLVIELLFVMLTVMQFNSKKISSKNHMVKITDDIYVPEKVGNGQYGNARFATKSEKKKMLERVDATKGVGGIIADCIDKKPYCIKDEINTLLIGATGTGKTRRIIIESLCSQLEAGYNLFVPDVKGDLTYMTSKYAKKLGYRVIEIDYKDPRKGLRYNYLQQIIKAYNNGDEAKMIELTWDLTSVLVNEPKGEKLWYNGETATIAAIILVVVIDAPEEYKNMTNVYYFLAYMCKSNEDGEMPINAYMKKLRDDHPAKGVFAIADVAPYRTRGSFFTSALSTLRLFTSPYVADMSSDSDFNLEDLAQEKSIIYFRVPDNKKTYYSLAAIFIVQYYNVLIDVSDKHGLRLPIKTDFVIDEAGNIPRIPIFSEMTSAGRSRGVRINAVLQDYQQFVKEYKDDYSTIMGNFRAKLFVGTDDEKTVKGIVDMMGNYTVATNSVSSSISDSMQAKGSYSNSKNMTGRKQLEVNELTRIKEPYGLLRITGEHPAIVNLPDLNSYKWNHILGLGDAEYNNKLFKQREEERPIRCQNPKLRLWGIWDEIIEENKVKNERDALKNKNEQEIYSYL